MDAVAGRRSAQARTAHLLCELYVRLGIVGLTDGLSFRLDLTQVDLSECLGLTSVPENRTLKALREAGLVEFRGGVVAITDLGRLRALAGFNPACLYLEQRPR